MEVLAPGGTTLGRRPLGATALGSTGSWERHPFGTLGAIAKSALLELSSRHARFSSQSDGTGLEPCPGAHGKCEDVTGQSGGAYSQVCLQLLDARGVVLDWGRENFWDITNRKNAMWDNQIRSNGGDSWCTPLSLFAKLIQKVGCKNVQIRCAATDIGWVMKESYWEKEYTESLFEDVDFAGARECVRQLCAPVSMISSPKAVTVWPGDGDAPSLRIATAVAGGVAGVLSVSFFVAAVVLQRHAPPVSAEAFLG